MSNECFPCNSVEQEAVLATCPCGNIARRGQRDYHACHAEAQREYRARERARAQANHDGYLALIAAKHNGGEAG